MDGASGKGCETARSGVGFGERRTENERGGWVKCVGGDKIDNDNGESVSSSSPRGFFYSIAANSVFALFIYPVKCLGFRAA